MLPCQMQGKSLWASKQICGAPLRIPNGRGFLRGRKCPVKMSMTAPPVEYDVVKVDGSAEGTEILSLRVAGEETAKGIVHRYLVKVRRDMRQGSASTKTRAEVRGGGRKPYQQKGTGRARRGSTRSPLIRGGGVIFGPKPRDYSVKMNRKEKRLAMATAIQSAAGDILVCEDLNGKFTGKTKELVQTLAGMGVPSEDHCLVITKGENEMLERAGKNLRNLKINRTSSLSVYDILRADRILVEQDAFHYIQNYYGSDPVENSDSDEAPAPEETEESQE